MPEEEKKEKKDEDKIVLQVDMHCEGCKDKVRRALKCFPGLEKIEVDMKEQKVTVKGKLDARKVYETVKKKSGKRTILLYPDLKKEDEQKKEEPKKEEPPPDPEITVVLKVNMHCGACAKQIKKSLEKMSGVTEVSVDVANGIVTVKGRNIDPKKACDRVKRKSGKHCEIVPPPPPPPEEKKEENKEEKPAEEKKEEEKKEEEKKEEKPAEEKKEEEKPAEEKKEEAKPAEEKKEEAAPAAEEKKEDEKKEEEKREEKPAEEKKEEAPAAAAAAEEAKVEIKKYEYIPYRSVPEYVYPPQLFSDENPNACSIM